jgi:hypothetical protein
MGVRVWVQVFEVGRGCFGKLGNYTKTRLTLPSAVRGLGKYLQKTTISKATRQIVWWADMMIKLGQTN